MLQTQRIDAQSVPSHAACCYFSAVETGRIPLKGFFTNTADGTGLVTSILLSLESRNDEARFTYLANRHRNVLHATLWETRGQRYFVMGDARIGGYTTSPPLLGQYLQGKALVRLLPATWHYSNDSCRIPPKPDLANPCS